MVTCCGKGGVAWAVGRWAHSRSARLRQERRAAPRAPCCCSRRRRLGRLQRLGSSSATSQHWVQPQSRHHPPCSRLWRSPWWAAGTCGVAAAAAVACSRGRRRGDSRQAAGAEAAGGGRPPAPCLRPRPRAPTSRAPVLQVCRLGRPGVEAWVSQRGGRQHAQAQRHQHRADGHQRPGDVPAHIGHNQAQEDAWDGRGQGGSGRQGAPDRRMEAAGRTAATAGRRRRWRAPDGAAMSSVDAARLFQSGPRNTRPPQGSKCMPVFVPR